MASSAKTILAPYVPTEGVETVTFRTTDGEELFGYFKKPRPGSGMVVSFHGNGGFPEHHVLRFERGVWRDNGWGFLVVTYRGFYRSTGVPTEPLVLSDAKEVFDYAVRRVDGAPILLHGHSLGAAVALATAAERPVIGLYLEAPFASMSAMARLRFPIFPTGYLLEHTYRSDLRISSVKAPIVIVHGRDDEIIPDSQGKSLASLASDRTRFLLIPGSHMGILGRADAEMEPFFRATFAAPLTP